jgi:serine protease AprX
MVERDEHGAEDTVVFGIRWDGGKRPRNGRKWLTAAIAIVAAALLPAAVQASTLDAPAGAALRTAVVVPVPGQAAGARALVARLGGHAGRRLAIVHGFAARVPADALARLAHAGVVRSAVPDVPMSVRSDDAASGADAATSSMRVVRTASGAQALQDHGDDGTGVAVALVDSGVMELPGLDSGQVVRGPDFSSDADVEDRSGLDAFGHGTHLAGIIAGHDADGGFSGVAPGAQVVSVKVAAADGSTSLLRVLAGLDWVRRNADRYGIRVVNLSMGVDAASSSYVHDPLAYAAETLWHSGLVVVAAAGNAGTGKGMLDMPAGDPYVIAVGALDTNGTADPSDDQVASFSSRGDGTRRPDFVAPGSAVVSLRVPGGTLDTAFPAARVGERFFRGSGTSQAAAVASGLAALLLEQRPGLDPDQVKALLADAARDVPGDPLAEGAGAVDAAAASAAPAPALDAVRQTWAPARLELKRLGHKANAHRNAGSAAEWAGRTWSGRTWSGRTWSGRTWSGRTWSGGAWDDGAAADQ